MVAAANGKAVALTEGLSAVVVDPLAGLTPGGFERRLSPHRLMSDKELGRLARSRTVTEEDCERMKLKMKLDARARRIKATKEARHAMARGNR